MSGDIWDDDDFEVPTLSEEAEEPFTHPHSSEEPAAETDSDGYDRPALLLDLAGMAAQCVQGPDSSTALTNVTLPRPFHRLPQLACQARRARGRLLPKGARARAVDARGRLWAAVGRAPHVGPLLAHHAQLRRRGARDARGRAPWKLADRAGVP